MKTKPTKPSDISKSNVRGSRFKIYLQVPLLLTSASVGLGQPVITQQPQSCTNAIGTTATFTVAATGAPPLAYQWQKLYVTWSDMGCTAANFVLTNVQTGYAGDYRVIITNVGGAVTSAVAHLTVVTPPLIIPATSLQSTAVFAGGTCTSGVRASGTLPVLYQWQLNGQDLSAQTNSTLVVGDAQATDEGDYTVVVRNAGGVVTNDPPVRLWVVPTPQWVKGNITNRAGLRLPYFYNLPANYDPGRSYPLFCFIHGCCVFNENVLPDTFTGSAVASAWASYKQQASDPVIAVWPTRPQSDTTSGWTVQYLQLVSAMFDALMAEFNIDPDRVYVMGHSEGVHAAWDLIGLRPGFFAAAWLNNGWQGSAPVATLKQVPFWVFSSQGDTAVPVADSRTMVMQLRHAGATAIYTEFSSAGHDDTLVTAVCIPAAVDWYLAQRRGLPSTAQPLLSVTNPAPGATYTTGAGSLNLAGSAVALGEGIGSVSWANTANGASGKAAGASAWSAANIPFKPDTTNLVVLTATTTSWAPAWGGSTTFNGSITVVSSPIRAILTSQGSRASLNWTGGGPPYRIQRATDLALDDWTDVLSDATPPVTLPLSGRAGFYRIVGQ